jgi:dTMP kinase
MTKYSGLFITLEGIDGSGKTTCAKAAVARLREAGIHTVFTKEPGDSFAGSDLGNDLRRLLWVKPTTKAMAPGVADLLFLADHLQNTEKIVRPALAAGSVVVCDRWADSQFAYATHPAKAMPDSMLALYETLRGPMPDITILLVCDPETAWGRSKARRGMEGLKQAGKAWEGAAAQAAIQDAYLRQLSGQPRTKILSVDGKGEAEVADAAYWLIAEACDAKA